MRLSVLPDPGVGVVSLETASPPEVLPLGRPTDARGPTVLGYGFPSRTTARCRAAGSSIRTAETPYRSSVGQPFRAASCEKNVTGFIDLLSILDRVHLLRLRLS
jgi:hypothetical protein